MFRIPLKEYMVQPSLTLIHSPSRTQVHPNQQIESPAPDAGCSQFEDSLEHYACGTTLSDAAALALESHLLACEQCQQKLSSLDTFISSLSLARQQQPTADLVFPAARKSSLSGVLVSLLALVLMLVHFAGPSAPSSSPQQVDLISTRSASNIAYRAAQPILISLQPEDLIEIPNATINIIAADGFTLHRSPPRNSSRLLLPAGLPSGKYWIQIMAEGNATPHREFTILIQP